MTNLIGKSLGRYHILEQLGEGGMATVYKAFDTHLERSVAVKVLRTDQFAPGVMSRTLKRFEREAKALGRLTHPNIVQIIDYGDYEGKPYLVMPFVPGQTLKHKLKGQPIPYEEAVRLLLPIARSLEYAHQQGVIHRDIKPSNVLITESGEPMLSDFGVAKIVDEEATMDLTGTSASVGTPEYMAPEQATSKTVDARADIYSLGVVFYEMVTGRKPYTADTPLAVLIKHASEPLPRPKLVVPTLPDKVEQIILKSLAKKPEDRYQSMEEFAIALERCLSQATSYQVKVKTTHATAKPGCRVGVPGQIVKSQTQKETPPIVARPSTEATSNNVSNPQSETALEGTSNRTIHDNTQKPSRWRNWAWIAGSTFVLLVCLSLGGGSLGMAILGGLIKPPTTAQPNKSSNTQIALKPTVSSIIESQSPTSTSTLIPLPTTKPLGIVDNRRPVLSATNANSIIQLAMWKVSNYAVTCVAFSPDGSVLASSLFSEFLIKLINISDGRILHILSDHIYHAQEVSFSPDGNMLVSGSRGNTGINIWRLSDWSHLRTMNPYSTYDVLSIDISPDGSIIAAGTDTSVDIWRVSDGIRLRTLGGFAGLWVVGAVSFSPDGTMLASGSGVFKGGSFLGLWRISDGSLLQHPNTSNGQINSVDFSPDGKTVASGGDNNLVELWRVSDGSILKTLKGHSESVLSVAFSSDGTLLASGSSDNTVKLWRVSDGALLQTLEGHTKMVYSVAFSPDGRILASSSDDGTIRVWGVH